MKNYFKLTKLVVCLLAITIFSSCNFNDVKRGFIGDKIQEIRIDSTENKDSAFFINKDLSKKEHRVYYVDNSLSMKKSNLIGRVKENLKQTINSLPNGTEVEIIVFSDADLWQDVVNGGVYTPSDKQIYKTTIKNSHSKKELNNFIDAIKLADKLDNTHHSIAINDFLVNRCKPDMINIMYLLTDGVDESDRNEKDRNGNTDNPCQLKLQTGIEALNKWKRSDSIYGVYVALNSAANTLLCNEFNNSDKHLYVVNGCNLQINLFRLNVDSILVENVSCPKKYIIGVSGECPKDMKFSNNKKQYADANYTYEILSVPNKTNKNLQLEIKPNNQPLCNLPSEHISNLQFLLDWDKTTSRKNYPEVGMSLMVKCLNTTKSTIAIAEPQKLNTSTIKYRTDKVFWHEDNPDTLTYYIHYRMSNDIVKFNKASLGANLLINIPSIEEPNKYVQLLNARGEKQSEIDLPISSDTTICFKITIDKEYTSLPKNASIKVNVILKDLTNIDALYLGKKQIKKHNDSYVLVDDFELQIKQRWELWKWCLLALLLLLVLIADAIIIYFIMCYKKAAKFPGDLGQSIVFTGTGLDAPMGFSMNFDGFLVESLAYNAIKTHKLSSTFVQKIIIHNGHYNEYKPSFWEKHTKGDIIYLTSNDFIDGIMEKIEITPIGKKQDFVARFNIFATTNSTKDVKHFDLALGKLNTVNSQVNSNERILNYNLTVMGSILIPPTATHSTYTN